jgi:protein phosphatase
MLAAGLCDQQTEGRDNMELNPATSSPFIEIAALSDTGTERGHNEDSCGKLQTSPTAGLVAVADGMSAFEGGELASQRAILGLLRMFRDEPTGRPLANRLLRSARNANFEVYEMAVVVPQLRGMSSTLTALAVEDGKVACVHVGNNRVYRIRDGEIEQLSKDHTMGEETPNPLTTLGYQGRSFIDRQVLTRSLGRELMVTLDLFETSIEEGEVLLLCTDGLYTVLEEREMALLATSSKPPAAWQCAALADR